MAKQANTWSLFLRYQAQAERHYRRAVEEFERIRALRDKLPEPLPPPEIQDSPNEPILEVQPEEKEPTSAPETEPISTPEPPAPQVAAELSSLPTGAHGAGFTLLSTRSQQSPRVFVE